MEESRSSPATVRFACFELNQYAGELRKEDGKCIRLQEQPLQILRVLLEHPGQIITRERLRRRVWPSDTFADFDQRHQQRHQAPGGALGDTAETPRYIETLPGRGCRFNRQNGTGTSSTANRIQSLAVLPLENLSRDPDQDLYI